MGFMVEVGDGDLFVAVIINLVKDFVEIYLNVNRSIWPLHQTSSLSCPNNSIRSNRILKGSNLYIFDQNF